MTHDGTRIAEHLATLREHAAAAHDAAAQAAAHDDAQPAPDRAASDQAFTPEPATDDAGP